MKATLVDVGWQFNVWKSVNMPHHDGFLGVPVMNGRGQANAVLTPEQNAWPESSSQHGR